MMKTADCFLSQISATPKASDVCVNGFADNEHTKKIVREQTASVDWFKLNRINLEKTEIAHAVEIRDITEEVKRTVINL